MSHRLDSRRLSVVVAAMAVAVFAHPAGAAPKSGLHITDPVGDANGINGQDTGESVPSVSTSPASVSGADITGIELGTDFAGKGRKRKAVGFHVTMKLAAPLQKGVLITVTMDSSVPCGETNTIQLGYGTAPLAVCEKAGTSTTNDDIGDAEISDDNTAITWHIGPIFKPGVKISNFYASSSVFVLGVFDETYSSGVFTYGK